MKLWPLRFSIRTLVIVVTLLCCYAACWGPTQGQGVYDVKEHLDGDLLTWPRNRSSGHSDDWGCVAWDASATLPLVVRLNVWEYTVPAEPVRRRYYFWFFGYIVKIHERPNYTVLPLAT